MAKFHYFFRMFSKINIPKTWTAIDRLSILWNFNPSDELKRDFFQAVAVLMLLYGCTTWMLTKQGKRIL